jgi:rod shape-determining protein MreC
MAIYTVGRRRIIVALLLTLVLLLTLDLRGNPVLDRVRDGFARAMAPY